eukprot:scaffold5482_cov444-Prasinococcus_capsulatus_cf.AAC.1
MTCRWNPSHTKKTSYHCRDPEAAHDVVFHPTLAIAEREGLAIEDHLVREGFRLNKVRARILSDGRLAFGGHVRRVPCLDLQGGAIPQH